MVPPPPVPVSPLPMVTYVMPPQPTAMPVATRPTSITLVESEKGRKLQVVLQDGSSIQCKKMVLELISENAYKVKTGMFSNWYTRAKKEVGLA